VRIVGAFVALALAVLVAHETLVTDGDSTGWQIVSTVFAVLSVATLLTLAMIAVRRTPPPRTVVVLLISSVPTLLLLWFLAMLFYTDA
jgi:hypothetical protein